jgi:hypothetical protein
MKKIGLVVLLALVAASAVVVTRAATRAGQEDIYLEGKNDVGPRPFTTIAATTQCPAGTEQVLDHNSTSSEVGASCLTPAEKQQFCQQDPTEASCAPPTTSPTAQPEGSTTTALFGGSGSQKVCDPEALIAFLMANPDKAAAWVQALNADPSLEWSGGNKLTVADIPTYIRELTPTVLVADTRVTNHGYVDSKATPRQSILQAGTAVLVDKNDIPRVRCACGNPLTRPHKVENPNYVGECWPGCLDEPPCAPPGCSATTTTTEPPTTTTIPATTTTCVPGVVGGNGCGPPRQTTTSRRTDKTAPTTRPSTTMTRPPITRPPTTRPPTTRPPTTTTRPPAPTTTRNPDCPPPGPVDCKP